MPRAGGVSAKLGEQYEERWTVFCMIEVMDEKADSIQVEKVGEDSAEFFLKKNGTRELHQVKRQKSGLGRWTLKVLGQQKVKVLSNFWQALKDTDVVCRFVSSQDADQLNELAERARESNSLQEFKDKYLNTIYSDNFSILRQKWSNCSEFDAYTALKRVFRRTIDDEQLVNDVEYRLEALVEGDPQSVRLDLAEFALSQLNKELTAHDIWHYLLDERGYQRRDWGKDQHVLAAVEHANDLYLSTLKDAKINGKFLPRDEVSTVLEKLTNSQDRKGVLLAGEAGIGKSGITRQVIQSLRNRGIPFLAFRVDRLEPNCLPDNIGKQLGLPASPALVLANISQQKKCVLVIDQLDAISLASGRNPDFFDCISYIIDQAKSHPNVRLLLVCRKFDVDNDDRLKSLTGQDGIAEAVSAKRLTSESVMDLVKELGLEVKRLGKKQIDLLSIPVNLSLLANIAKDPEIDALDFTTPKELYDKFWKYRQQEIHKRLKRTVQWKIIIDRLCQYMSDNQTLSAPHVFLDDYENDVSILASENILICEGSRISFLHESFFDYAFARRFSSEASTLSDFLRSSEQHLFRRAQVRQLLYHRRDSDFNKYLDELEELLNAPDIRYHLKRVIFALLGNLPDPQKEEWEIITASIQAPILNVRIWVIVGSSVAWFKLLDSLGLIEKWLKSTQEELIHQTLFLLSLMQKYIPDRVAEIIEPFVGTSDAWTKRLIHVLGSAKLSSGRRFFELFLKMIDLGVIDPHESQLNNDRGFWRIIYGLPKENPAWAAEAIGHYFERCLNLSLKMGQPNPFERDSGILNVYLYSNDELDTVSNLAPQAFVNFVLPFMLSVMELNARQEGEPPFQDPIWWARNYGSDYDIQHKLLKAMEVSLSKLAAQDSESFSQIIEKYILGSDFETIQYLLIRAYAANGKIFADDAVTYLLERPARLMTGYAISNSDHGPYWATYLLIESVTPYASQDKLDALESLLLDYYPRFETSAEGRYIRGYAQFILIQAIDSLRSSNPIQKRLQELERKFTSERQNKAPIKFEPPESIEARSIGPAVPQSAGDKMTDEQWLKAIRQYKHEIAGDWFEKYGELVGGARQISQVLENQVKKDPIRFAQLAHQFPNDASVYYFHAVLGGLSQSDVDPETALKVCQRCHNLPFRPCGKQISWLVQNLPALPWNEELFDIIIWYVLNDPDPEQELWRTDAGNGQFYYGGKILDAAVNSVRGSAAQAIANLIFADKERSKYFLPTLQKIVLDHSIAVRSCVVMALTGLLNYDRDIAVDLFLRLIEIEDILLSTSTAERFVFYAMQTHFEKVEPILQRMLSSKVPDVVRLGARQACVAYLYIEEATSLVDACLSGTKEHRLGLAETCSAQLRKAYFRERCESLLIQLFNDADKDVRAEAARCFFNFEDEIADYTGLIEAFIQSPAFLEDSEGLMWSLEKTTAKLPELTYLIKKG